MCTNANNKKMVKTVQGLTGKAVTCKDIQNLKANFKDKAAPLHESIQRYENDPSKIIRITVSKANEEHQLEAVEMRKKVTHVSRSSLLLS